MAQEYVIKSVKKGREWGNDFGKFQSYALALDGVGEPVQLNKKVPVKNEPKEGDTLYGILEEKIHEGRIYYKFKVEKKPDSGYSGKGSYQPRDDEAIRAQFALKLAVQAYGPNQSDDQDIYFADIETYAKHFYAMVDRVKGSDKTIDEIKGAFGEGITDLNNVPY
ncbi:MAG TPA: hypothetical protein VJ836_00590 [Candidatus Saccharimonadales bacterium]|nr:hypothetical protein [Candidatus Saccharimonadales bacterium]